MNTLQLLKYKHLFNVKNPSWTNSIACHARYSSSKISKWRMPEEIADIPKSTIEKYTTAQYQTEKGWPYDSKPFRMLLEKGKDYWWCSCGWSHDQPMCDTTHQKHYFPVTMKPLRFQVAETKEYWLCCCKQTKNRPFCDGSHRDPQIQDLCKDKVVATG